MPRALQRTSNKRTQNNVLKSISFEVLFDYVDPPLQIPVTFQFNNTDRYKAQFGLTHLQRYLTLKLSYRRSTISRRSKANAIGSKWPAPAETTPPGY